MTMSSENARAIDEEALRAEVRSKYREVAVDPHKAYHFHTGRFLAARLGYDTGFVDTLPDVAVESFAGVANAFSFRPIERGAKVIDIGSGAGFDSFVAANKVGATGRVIGVDMTDEMLSKARATATAMRLEHVEFREGWPKTFPWRTAGQMSRSAMA
jgi:cyclopropane fatty-acyl-phospholipid synthase-like methyltransferase